MNLRHRENILFDDWAASVRGFVRDGAGRLFEEEPLRLLYILKEANDEDEGEQDLRDIIDKGNVSRTWNNIARWSALIFDNAEWERVVRIDQEKRVALVSRTAMMNLKKQAGTSVAVMDKVSDWALKNSARLRQQAALYNPHITIACGTFDIVRQVFELSSQIEHDGDPAIDKYCDGNPYLGVILNFYHPQVRKAGLELYNQMKKNIEHLRKAGLLLRFV